MRLRINLKKNILTVNDTESSLGLSIRLEKENRGIQKIIELANFAINQIEQQNEKE